MLSSSELMALVLLPPRYLVLSWISNAALVLQHIHCSFTRNNGAPFTLVLNLIVPGPPWRNLVMSWAADYSPSSSSGGLHSRSQTPKTSLAGRCASKLLPTCADTISDASM